MLHQFLPGYCAHQRLSPRQAEVCAHICACRTEVLGGLQLHCDHCGYEQPWYHAFRDRHCPKCQWRATEAWCDKQCQSVLPVTYYHLVFTLPHELNGWVQLHPELIYHLLFKAVWATLKSYEVARRRIPVSALPLLARLLAVSIDELLGEPTKQTKSKRGPTPKLQQQMERVSLLPRSKQKFVIEMIDTVIQQAAH